MTEDEIKAEIAEQRRLAKEAAAPFEARAAYLKSLLDGPGVTPVIHYMRYHSELEKEHYEDDLVSAFHYCEALIDSGNGAPIGVSVGGAMVTREAWRSDPRRPRDGSWDYFDD